MKTERDISLDYLKAIAMLGLIASHVFFNKFIMQIRSFDVNLLIIISAYLASRGKKRKYVAYVKKRFERLVIPTWIFITIYLGLNSIFSFQTYSLKQIIRSYLLLNNSIGYIWIIYVYLICAVIMPFLNKVDLNKSKDLIIVIMVTIVYLAMCKISDNYYYQLLVLYPIIYGLISLIGINFAKIDKKIWRIFGTILIGIFLLVAIWFKISTGHFVETGEYKYPPRLYYLAYSLGVSIWLMLGKNVFQYIDARIKVLHAVVSVLSEHSLWFYLWHILFLQIGKRLIYNSFIYYLFVVGMCFLIIALQNNIIELCERKIGKRKLLEFFKG